MNGVLLEVRDLKVEFRKPGRTRSQPLRGVDLDVGEAQIVGIVGETGCGKSLTGRAVLGALPAGAEASGTVSFQSTNLLTAGPDRWRQLRGRALSLIPQNPAASFSPVFSLGDQLAMLTRRHLGITGKAAHVAIDEELHAVGLDDPRRVRHSYPHQLSGGMLQRVAIAAALLPRPKLIVADEPTTALDVTIERQILTLIRQRQRELGVSVVLITHDVDVVRSTCDRVNVLYAGRVVESGGAVDVLAQPVHPYTAGLLAALPRTAARGRRLSAIRGSVPTDIGSVAGCAFSPRCPRRQPDCDEQLPAARYAAPSHRAECLHPNEVRA